MKVVVWSGGLDSTLLLAHELATQPRGGVKAITLAGHLQLPHDQLACERVARAEFKKWARARGWKFRHETVRVKTSGNIHNDVGQSGIWLSHLMPYLQGGDTALFGYIRGDDFWHWRHLFVAAFGALAASHFVGSSLLVNFPLEWHRKRDVVEGARLYRLPRRCWWTCEKPVGDERNRRCGRCSKCRESKRAKVDLRDLGTSYGITVLRPPSKKDLALAKAKKPLMDQVASA